MRISDFVAFYEKPLRKFDRLLKAYLALAPAGFPSFLRAIPIWLKDKLFLPKRMREKLPGYTKAFVYPSHHESHAASAFFPSPFQETAILTMDGVGEWATASIGLCRGNRIELLRELHFSHSLASSAVNLDAEWAEVFGKIREPAVEGEALAGFPAGEFGDPIFQ